MLDAERLCIVDAPSLSAVTTNQGFRSGKVPGSVLVQAAGLSTRLRGVGVGCNGNDVDAQLTRLLCRLQTNLPICRRVLSCVLYLLPALSLQGGLGIAAAAPRSLSPRAVPRARDAQSVVSNVTFA